MNGNHNTLGQSEGAGLGSRGTRHNHGSHSHPIQMNQDGATSGGYVVVGVDHAADGNGTTLPTQVGPGGTPQDTSAYLTINFIIVA